jgi:hypothetical protein
MTHSPLALALAQAILDSRAAYRNGYRVRPVLSGAPGAYTVELRVDGQTRRRWVVRKQAA